MAMYHFHMQIFKRGEGRSAVGGAAYRAGEKFTNEYDGVTHDYTKRNSHSPRDTVSASAYRSGENIGGHDFSAKKGVVYSEIMLPENAPREYLDRETLWNAIEKKDRRRDAQLARECDISLPIELTTEQQIELVRDFVQENFVDKGICADVNIHDYRDGNPHFHLQVTMRYVDENGFGNRRAEEQGKGYLQKEQRLIEWRKSWADTCNRHLEKHGFDERIDHRTLAEQGITDREPQKYMGQGYTNRKAREQAKLKQEQMQQAEKIVEPSKSMNQDDYWQAWKELYKGEGHKAMAFQNSAEQKAFARDLKISNAEIRRIERQIENLEKHREYLTELHEKSDDLAQKRLKARGRKARELDTQIDQTEKMQKYYVSIIERDIQQFERASVAERMTRNNAKPIKHPPIPSRPTPDRVISREISRGR